MTLARVVSRVVARVALLILAVPSLAAEARAQGGASRPGFSFALGAGAVRATGLADARAQGMVGARFSFPQSPLMLRADGAVGAGARDPNVATAALGLRVLDAGSSSVYVLAGFGSYSGRHVTRPGRHAGGGIEARPSLLRGRAVFAEARAHAYGWSDLAGHHTDRLTTVVAGLWW